MGAVSASWRSHARHAGVALALAVFGAWCVLLVLSVESLRRQVELRVGWLAALQRAQASLDADASSAANELARALPEVCSAHEGELTRSRLEVCPELEAATAALSTDAWDEPAKKRLRVALDGSVRALRAETALLSRTLGDRWS